MRAVCRIKQDLDDQQQQIPRSGGVSGIDQGTPLPATISHLLFDPTLLSSTGRRRITLRNETTGDLPVRWEMSEIFPLQDKKQQRLPKVSGMGLVRARPAALPSVGSNGVGTPIRAAGAAAAPTPGRDHGAGAEGSPCARTSLAEAGATAAAATHTPRNTVDGRADKSIREDLSSTSRSLAAPAPSPGCPVVGATAAMPLPAGGKAAAEAEEAAAAGVVGRAPDAGPFGIFPEFAVVPAHGEFAFEVAFSPAGLQESR